MSDLISRQDAMDALLKRDAGCGIDSAEVIKDLPSAQQWIPCSCCMDAVTRAVGGGR